MTKAESDEAIQHFTIQYNDWRQKLPALPALEELDREFDILESLGREKHFPRNAVKFTRWYMMRTVNSWAGYLHEFILPNQQSAVSMEEYNYFNEQEKNGIIDILNWIMYRSREGHSLQFDEEEAKTAEFIGAVFLEWCERKKALKKVIEKNADVWRDKVNGSVK